MMLLLDKNSKNEIKNHFHTVQLSVHQKKKLEELLLTTSRGKSFWSSAKDIFFARGKFFASHFLTAAAAVCITCLANTWIDNSKHDVISEVASSHDVVALPADFNLDGNLDDLQEFINDSLPNHQAFKPELPKQLVQNYSAYEGRFFLFNGSQGVSINMVPTALGEFDPSVLYILKLTKNSESSFPVEKQLRKIRSATGKIKRVYAWREGTYGYAMVAPAPAATSLDGTLKSGDLP